MKELFFNDLHQHILWGLDDGPQTPEEMYAMLDSSAQNRISLIAATTHAYPRVQPFDYDRYRRRLSEANAYCQSQGLPILLVEGCEIRYSDRVPDLLTDRKLPTIGNSRYVLVEFSEDTTLHRIESAADGLYDAGFQPIVAHVERCSCLVRSTRTAMQLRDGFGLLYQMDCETCLRPRGLFERNFVRRMLEEQAIDLIATDAHDTQRRPINMQETYQKLSRSYERSYVRQMVCFGQKLGLTPENEDAADHGSEK